MYYTIVCCVSYMRFLPARLNHHSSFIMAGPGQEPPDVRRARRGGDPKRADQRAGGEEQPAREGKLPVEEPGQPRAAGEVPVAHPGRCSGQSKWPDDPRPASAAEHLQLQHRLCCVSGSALGRAEPLSFSSNGPPC